jgi:hypothetical protein
MPPNHELTNVLKGRVIGGFEENTGELAIGFQDGSTLRVKILKVNNPVDPEGVQIREVSEAGADLVMACEDDSTIAVTLSEPGNSISLRDKHGRVEYLG